MDFINPLIFAVATCSLRTTMQKSLFSQVQREQQPKIPNYPKASELIWACVHSCPLPLSHCSFNTTLFEQNIRIMPNMEHCVKCVKGNLHRGCNPHHTTVMLWIQTRWKPQFVAMDCVHRQQQLIAQTRSCVQCYYSPNNKCSVQMCVQSTSFSVFRFESIHVTCCVAHYNHVRSCVFAIPTKY